MLRFAPRGNHGKGNPANDELALSGRVLVVDDDQVSRAMHRAILARRFDVLTASTGSEALALCQQQLPDLVLLDVEMPVLDGYETCRLLRKWTGIPIIFATSHQSLEEHLKAYDVGGNDIVTKPVSSEILLRKVSVAISQYRAAESLVEEKKAVEKMAMAFLSSASQSGTLMNFMRSSIVCQDYHALANELLAATRDFGLSCLVQIRHQGDCTAVTARGALSPLEIAILENASEMGRVFQFKQRLVVNNDRVSIVVQDMPNEADDPVHAGGLRDDLVILSEAAEAFAVNVDMRLEAQKRAEQLQIALSGAEAALNELAENQRAMLMDTRLLLQELIDDIEKTYTWLNTSQAQETTINSTMEHAVQRVLGRLGRGGDFDTLFAQVMQALSAGRGENLIELF
ncbi:response regulator [Dechloromonas hortensis]|uniref:response regulator n=1 Tax=Dechloromonas hortensis TaxID=337779 RepID=UPI001291BAAC|nr:response regulator [Dechloromonas hortensis]